MSYTLRSGQVIAGLEPDEVKAAGFALRFYGGQIGPGDSLDQPDAMAHALAAAAAWRSRLEADERAHEFRHSLASREGLALLALCDARQQARKRTKKRTAADEIL